MHVEKERRTIKHIRKEKKLVCPVCKKEFTQHHNLKTHIIKNHDSDDVKEKGIEPRLIVGPLYDPKKINRDKTDF